MSDSFEQSIGHNRPRYQQFETKLADLMKTLLAYHNVAPQSVTSRVKDTESAMTKAARPDQQMSSVADLHDFLGLRVITYFADQVDLVAELLRSNFDVDESRTKDRRRSIGPDQFGYLSMHLAIRLNEQRRSLAEWSGYADIWAEVQIRSSLQHSWAEIEHDLGYKTSSGAIPDHLRRRFSRLAGLLEIADDEFLSLRDDLADYEADVSERVESGGDAAIDQASISALITSGIDVREADQQIASLVHAPGIKQAETSYAGRRAQELQAFGLNSIREVREALRSRSELLPELASSWMLRASDASDLLTERMIDASGHWIRALPAGISLYYLNLLLRAERGREALADTFIAAQDIERFQDIFAELHSADRRGD